MKHISKILWLIPLAAHLGYVLATYRFFPKQLGDSQEAALPIFLVEWALVILLTNIAFVAIYLRLPTFNDRMLSVPGKAYWLSNGERRAELIEKLRGICEISLFLMNIFFFAVYQMIYQTNVQMPIMRLPRTFLLIGFMGLPLLAAFVHIGLVIRSLSRTAKNVSSG